MEIISTIGISVLFLKFKYNKKQNKIHIGIGDAIGVAQIFTAGGIENALASSQFLSNSILKESTGIQFDIQEYYNQIYNNLPLPSKGFQMNFLLNILNSTPLTTFSLAMTGSFFPVVDKLVNRLFYT